MDQLIKIESGNGIETVNARELHEFIESKQDFSTWIKNRILKYGFIEGVDFTIHKFVESKATKIDYHISIDMAKELSMVENNEKGRQARRYFIEMEKKAKAALPQSLPEALRLAADKAEEVERLQIELDKEKSWYSVKRVKSLGLLPDLKVHNIWRPLKKWCIENNYQIRSIFDANYGDVKTYPAEAWKAVYGLDLAYRG